MITVRILTIFLVILFCFKIKVAWADIDVFDAIKIAEDIIVSDENDAAEYNAKALEIIYARKYYKPYNLSLQPCMMYLDNEDRDVDAMSGEIMARRGQDYELCNMLKERRYWLIYFSHICDIVYDVRIFGGDIAFFIDSETSEVIYVYRSR